MPNTFQRFVALVEAINVGELNELHAFEHAALSLHIAANNGGPFQLAAALWEGI